MNRSGESGGFAMDNLSSPPGYGKRYPLGGAVKIGCHCGETIYDSTDNLPSKGHIIPDEDWFDVYDGIDDDVIDPVSAGTLTVKDAYMRSRHIISSTARLIWQCGVCGRLYIDVSNGQLECFIPESENTDRRILRSRKNRG